jgi:hypothetical protein
MLDFNMLQTLLPVCFDAETMPVVLESAAASDAQARLSIQGQAVRRVSREGRGQMVVGDDAVLVRRAACPAYAQLASGPAAAKELALQR